MQVSIESVGVLGRKVKVEVPAEDVEKEFGERLKRLSQRLKVPGFRPGKVPLKMVEAQHGGRLMEEIAGDLIQSSLREVIIKEGLRPVAGPRIEEHTIERGKALAYTAAIEIFPEIKKLDIADVSIERPVATVGADDIDRTLETIRKQRTIWNPVTRAAQLGDRVKIDFVGFLKEEPMAGGTAKDFLTVLGGGTLIEDLENGLVGTSAGDSKTVNARFPDSYRHQPLAGQTARFEVTIHEVAEPQLPEVNSDFARLLGIADGDLEKMRGEIKANLEREIGQRARRVVRSKVLKALLAANAFEVPTSLVESEIANLRRMEQSTGTRSDDAVVRQRATQRVATALTIGEVVRTRAIKAEPSRIRTKLEELASEYESPEMFIRWHYEEPQRFAQIESLVVEEKAVEELIGQAKVEDKPVSFQELLKLEAEAY
jgi:trigger factor